MIRIWRRGVWICMVVCMFSGVAMAAHGARTVLPPEVVKGAAKFFPGAMVRSVGAETEKGMSFYELGLNYKGLRLEAEVDKYGSVGEIEQRISFDEVPRELADVFAQMPGLSRDDIEIERHERWGMASGDRFVPLDEPEVFYELELVVRGQERELRWTPGKPLELPAPVATSFKAAFPKAIILEAEQEQVAGTDCYEVSFIQYGVDKEVLVSAAGMIIEVKTRVFGQFLPHPVVKTIRQLATGSRVKKVESVEIRAKFQDGDFVPVSPPEMIFEAEFIGDNKTTEIRVAPFGQLLQTEVDEDDADDADDDDDDGDDD